MHTKGYAGQQKIDVHFYFQIALQSYHHLVRFVSELENHLQTVLQRKHHIFLQQSHKMHVFHMSFLQHYDIHHNMNAPSQQKRKMIDHMQDHILYTAAQNPLLSE